MAEAQVQFSRDVQIDTGTALLDGDLTLPVGTRGVVVFAHGSGSSRRSPRNRAVASVLHEARLGTLLFDLLTPEEVRRDDRTRALRFDVALLSERLIGALDWLDTQPAVVRLPLALFGASTGAAAAMVAAAARPSRVAAVVSRGGRIDLAGTVLARVRAATLAIVGGADSDVLVLNQRALDRLPVDTPHTLEVIADADHLFTGPGQLEEVARVACAWLQTHLTPGPG
jgi:dienelactone hydrolase